MAPDQELFLLDGNSLAYRAFFALPETMATSDGRPTNAIFGFASMLTKLIDEFRPAGVVVAWDAGMSGREEVYPEYKAQRPPRPDLLSEQWPQMMPMVEAFGYTNVKVDGYEADDVLATLSELAAAEGIDVVVVSGDRDVYQLVREGIRVMTTGRGITDTKMYDRETVIERWGVPPELVTDLIGLKGDTSDNIPGVPGIGEKTAAALLQEFGSLEAVLASVDKISGPKRKQNLTEHAEDARVSKRLATMERAVELEIDLPALMSVEPDRAALRKMMREFELRAVLERLEEALGEGAVPAEEAEPAGSEAVVEAVEVEVREGEPADLPPGPVALAILGEAWAGASVALEPSREGEGGEAGAAAGTEDVDGGAVTAGDGDGNSGATGDGKPVAAADGESTVTGDGGGAVAEGPILTGSSELAELAVAIGDRPVVGHDVKSLGGGRHGLLAGAAERGAQLRVGHDTLIAAYLLEPARRAYELTELAGEAGIATARAGAEQGQLSMDADEEAETMAPAEEARIVGELCRAQLTRLRDAELLPLLREIELPLIPVLASMERRGLKLDVERLGGIEAQMTERLAQLEARIFELAGREFTVGSPQQVGQVLFEELGLTRKRRGKTGYSTDARVLAQIRDEHPIVAEIEHWREISKLLNTYLDTLPDLIDPETGRIHTTFNQTVASTGRLSSIAPNLQNIPIRTDVGRPIRGCFVAEPGNCLLSADYSQVELRVLAAVAGEEVLKEVFRAGDDVHAATAAEVFGVPREQVDSTQRSRAKMVNFGIIYGLTGFGLADRLNISPAEGQEFVSRYLDRFPAVREFRDRTIAAAAEDGYVCTVMGRRRPVPELRSDRAQTRQLGERLAVNTVIQGSAADIIKLAMIRTDAALTDAGLETAAILQIHDELLFEGPEGEADAAAEVVEREMVGAYEMDPPLEVEVGNGPDWLQVK